MNNPHLPSPHFRKFDGWHRNRRRCMPWGAPGILLPLSLLLTTGCGSSSFDSSSASKPASIQSSAPSSQPAAAWKQVAQILGKSGDLRDGVYTLTFPRDDLSVRIDGMDVPTAAGITSTFRFYQCSCGKTVVLGEFVVTDYECNDVAYALQKENILISSMGPFLIYEKPRLMAVRFQAEGTPEGLARTIKSALDWVGPNRTPPPQKMEP
jgi:hypothetical protein